MSLNPEHSLFKLPYAFEISGIGISGLVVSDTHRLIYLHAQSLVDKLFEID